MSRRHLAALALTAPLVTAGCGSLPYRFSPAPPVVEIDDRRPSPVPKSNDFRYSEHMVRGFIEVPVLNALDVRRPAAAEDVNALDQVPSSSWFTPRLGAREVTPEELVQGPREQGLPQLPFIVTRVKSSGNPGFLGRDARGARYLVKFDPPEFPGIETTTALVVGRLFWGFGYNVPEDDLVLLERDQLRSEPEAGVSGADIDAILAKVAAPVNGQYRATFSRFIDGAPIGPIAARGSRSDDPNDRIVHERRRTLRALRMLGAFVNHSDMRPDNSLDVYAGEPGQGHVEHYLLDFGEAFGGHGAEHDRLWDGHESYIEFSRLTLNLVTLGLRVAPWERLEYTSWKSVGAFESQIFEPGMWRETTPYLPIRRADSADDYWAAKILAPLTRAHVDALIVAARYPEPGAGEYVADVLMERRQKVIDYALARVSPLELVGVQKGNLQLADLGATLMSADRRPARYHAELFDVAGHPLGAATVQEGTAGALSIRSERLADESADGYLRVDVTVTRAGSSGTSAQFHVRFGASGPRVVGIVH